MRKFRASVRHEDGVSYVHVAGTIDEDNELAELLPKIPSGMAVVDLGQIARMNSFGVRDWVNWVRSLEKHDTQVVLVDCAPAVVAQINLVFDFTGRAGVVESFRAPYVCPDCKDEKTLQIESAAMGSPPYQPPVCRCDACDRDMDFDDVAASYFAFLSGKPGR